MNKSLAQTIRDESLTAVANVGGSYEAFIHWNYILAMFDLKPIDSFVTKTVDVH